jgi:hypothetical protein
VGTKPLAERDELAVAAVVVVRACHSSNFAAALDDEVRITLRSGPEATKDVEQLTVDVDVAFSPPTSA